jgi:putative heme-binding domain-containing protein
LIRAITALLLATGALWGQAVMNAPAYTPQPAAIQALYTSLCGRCHGANGSGGRGPSLRAQILPHAPDAASMMQVILDGIPGTDMPSTQGLSIPEIAALAGYVRSFAQSPTPPPAGNPLIGATLMREKGKCSQCHTIHGKGGIVGPDLTDIGRRRTPAQLRAKLIDPEKSIAPDFLMAAVATRDGRKVAGIVAGEDTFSIRLREIKGGLHAFDKASLAELRYDRGKTPMPAFQKTFTDSEISDVVAYLASLGGPLW